MAQKPRALKIGEKFFDEHLMHAGFVGETP